MNGRYFDPYCCGSVGVRGSEEEDWLTGLSDSQLLELMDMIDNEIADYPKTQNLKKMRDFKNRIADDDVKKSMLRRGSERVKRELEKLGL